MIGATFLSGSAEKETENKQKERVGGEQAEEEPRLIVEALVKLSLEEAMLDFGGFYLT